MYVCRSAFCTSGKWFKLFEYDLMFVALNVYSYTVNLQRGQSIMELREKATIWTEIHPEGLKLGSHVRVQYECWCLQFPFEFSDWSIILLHKYEIISPFMRPPVIKTRILFSIVKRCNLNSFFLSEFLLLYCRWTEVRNFKPDSHFYAQNWARALELSEKMEINQE